MKKCLIYLEKGYETYSIDLLRVAQAMYGEEYHADALTVGGDISKAVGCFDRIFQVSEEAVPDYDLTAITDVLEELMEAEGFHSILIPATYTGRMLAPRAAMRLETGLVADITEVEVHDGSVIMVRPAFSGKIMAGIVNEETAPIMMSIRPGVFTCEAPASRNTETITLTPERRQPPRVVRVARQEKGISTDIRESEILVSGGGGVMKHMDVVEALAQALGWFVSLTMLAFVIFMLVVIFHPMGNIRLGGPNAKPKMNYWQWFTVALCAGIGTGVVFWGAVEPILFTFEPAPSLGLEPGSDTAVIWAMRTTYMHWTLTPYAIYATFGLILAYVCYNMRQPFTVSSGLVPLMGQKALSGKVAAVVDVLTVFALVGGIAALWAMVSSSCPRVSRSPSDCPTVCRCISASPPSSWWLISAPASPA